MKILFIHASFIIFILFIINKLFIKSLLKDNDKYISSQLKYFICKVIVLFLITFFFCFIFPLNSIKFILSTLVIFIMFHFTEAIIIQNKIDKTDNQ